MEAAQLAVRMAQLVVFGALALVSVRQWRHHRDPAAKWWTATVAILASVVGGALLIPEGSTSDLASWERKILLAGLVLFPYCLFQYGRQFVRTVPWLLRVAQSATVVVAAWVFFLPKLGTGDGPRPAAVHAFLGAFVLLWTALSSITTVRLWQAGKRQAIVARRRMQTMAFGTALLNLAVLVAAFTPRDDASGWPVAIGLLTIVCAITFFIGFRPPKALRMLWRSRDMERLRLAEMSLMTAVDPPEIGNALLPEMTALFGAQGAVLADPAGEVVASFGLTEVEAKATVITAMAAGDAPVVQKGLMSTRMRNGWVAVRGSAVSPFFGRDELDVLVGLGLFADLALDRAQLFEAERTARRDAERANEELETFVYSVSHDLKSPLVSLLGFLDYLSAEINGSLSDDGKFFLQRISAASLYMRELIQDLLELSRIGRVSTESIDVALEPLVQDIVAEQEGVHPDVRVVVGRLPVIDINPLRARQLFTNLVNNAIAHSGRPDVTVTVDAIDAPDGDVVVAVADNGKGIPEPYREKVFGVFERLERQDTTATSGGTGIGLAVCRKIAEQVGGDITISDNRPGARLSIRFPAPVVRRSATSLEVVK